MGVLQLKNVDKKHKGGLLVVFYVVLIVFSPYLFGTPYRPDQLILWFYIGLAIINIQSLKFTVFERKVFLFSGTILCFVLIRVFINSVNMHFTLQVVNQFSYLLGVFSLYIIHKKAFQRNKQALIDAILVMSIIVNLYGLFQFFFIDHPFVGFMLRLYGGLGNEKYAYRGFDTIAAKTLYGGKRFVSIFSGMHFYAIYNVFILGIVLGTFDLQNKTHWRSVMVIIAAIGAIIGSYLAASKSSFFGVAILLMVYFVMKRKSARLTVRIVLMATIAVITFLILRSHIWTLERIIGGFVQHGFFAPVMSRFGEGGYLANAANVLEPLPLVFGFGGEAVDYKYADSEYRQVMLIGGIALFSMFYTFLLVLAKKSYSLRKVNSFAIPLFAIDVAFLFIGIGIAVHMLARIIPLWMLTKLVLLQKGYHECGYTPKISGRSGTNSISDGYPYSIR